MAEPNLEGCMRTCKESAQTLTETIPNLRRMLKVKVSELNLEAHELATDAHWDIIGSLADQVLQTLSVIQSFYEAHTLSNETKDAELQAEVNTIRKTLNIEPSEDIDTKVKALLQATNDQETIVKGLRDSLLQSEQHLKQNTISHEKEVLQTKMEYSRLIEQMEREYSTATEKLQAGHNQNDLLRNQIAKLSLDLEAAEENRQHMIADHAKELSEVTRDFQRMEEAYSAQTLLMTQTKKTAATGPTSPATMSSDNLEGWENFGFGTASRRPDELRPSLVGPDTHQDHMGEQHDDTNFMADNDDETYDPNPTPDEDTPLSDKRVRSSVTPSPTKRARVRFDDNPPSRSSLQEISTPFQHQREADTKSNQQLLPSTQRTTRSGRSVLSSTTPSRSWQNAPVEQSRARALMIVNMFFFDWRVTAEENRSIQVIFNSLFSRGAAVNVYVGALDKHALGRFDMPPSLPHPCMIAQLKNKPAGNPTTGRLTMTRKSCNWCKQTDAICLWAVHVPGVDTGFGPRDSNGRITGDDTVWREPAIRTLSLGTGEQVRWILKRRKENQTDLEDPRTMSGPLFGDY